MKHPHTWYHDEVPAVNNPDVCGDRESAAVLCCRDTRWNVPCMYTRALGVWVESRIWPGLRAGKCGDNRLGVGIVPTWTDRVAVTAYRASICFARKQVQQAHSSLVGYSLGVRILHTRGEVSVHPSISYPSFLFPLSYSVDVS